MMEMTQEIPMHDMKRLLSNFPISLVHDSNRYHFMVNYGTHSFYNLSIILQSSADMIDDSRHLEEKPVVLQ